MKDRIKYQYAQPLILLRRWMFVILVVFSQIVVYSQEVIGVGGTLEENEVWTTEYLYVVRENLRVPDDIELVIMPGVIVEFYPNTGLFIEQGSLKVFGNYDGITDSVRFRPRGAQGWLGISFFSVTEEDDNIIDHATIENADIGIDIRNSKFVLIQNTHIRNGTTNDIRLFNSSFCTVDNNIFTKNGRNSIEIHASGLGSLASENIISNNRITESRLISIMVRFDNQGKSYDNLIENNFFSESESGIFIDNSSLFFNNDKIQIIGNVFSHLGSELVGYSISSGMDSTIIKNNIFYKNVRGVELRRGNGFNIENNSFYQNINCISIEPFARNVALNNNTLIENENNLVIFRESHGNSLTYNNIFANKLEEGAIRNTVSFDINITDNYWGTEDTTEIDLLLWDKNDNTALGNLNYQPILPVADTTAPMSPPQMFVKQLINGKVLLSWNKNPEKDLMGYAIYQGSFNNYSFINEPIITNDTSFTLASGQIEDDIAITAFDNSGFGRINQLLGHESPFAFAMAVPFAGLDTLVCKNKGEFHIAQSSIPFNYEELIWSSDGDGHFDNPSALNPTYIFGENDLINSFITITLTVNKTDEEVFVDHFNIILRDDPSVNIGDDMIISESASVHLNNTVVYEFDQINWETLGDGYFDDVSVATPTYFFGETDLEEGKAILVVAAISSCGIDTDTLIVYLREQFTVEGRVLNNGVPVQGAVVLAISELINSTKHITDITHTESDGTFIFKGLYESDYLFYAIPDTSIVGRLLPTYFVNKLDWQTAYSLTLEANTYHVEIELNSGGMELPAGEGQISGKFNRPVLMTGFDFYCQPWFTFTQQPFCNEGVSNITIFLYNDKLNKPLKYTLTDANGYFIFNNLPFGEYYIGAEKAGFETIKSSSISLSPSFPVRNDITLRIADESKIRVYVPDAKLPVSSQIYPNPTSSVVHIPIDILDTGIELISVYNTMGQAVKQLKITPGSNNTDFYTLDVSDLPDGLFLLLVMNAESSKTFSMIISR